MAKRSEPVQWPSRISWPKSPLALLDSPTAARIKQAGRGITISLRPISLNLDELLFLICLTLLGFGMLMVQSANARISSGKGNFFREFFLSAPALHAVLAAAFMIFIWRMDYRRLIGKTLWRSAATWLMALSLVFLALVLTRFGASINGAKRWLMIHIGSHAVGFEPSEIAKWALVVFVAVYAAHQQDKIRQFFRGFVPLIAVIGLTSLLILREDFGTTVLVAGVCGVLMLMAGCRWRHLAMLLPPAAAVLYFAILKSPYRVERLLIFLHPHMDPRGAGYNPIQSLLSFASGGFWGRGLGNGIQKMGYLPEDSTDFIFSLVAEELGFFGCMIIVLLFTSLTIAGWRIGQRCENLFGKMVAFGCTATIALQAAMNIAVVTVTVPTKGIALPLVSSGGTGWIMTAGAIGLLMSIDRVSRLEDGGTRHESAMAAPELSSALKKSAAGTPPAAASPV